LFKNNLEDFFSKIPENIAEKRRLIYAIRTSLTQKMSMVFYEDRPKIDKDICLNDREAFLDLLQSLVDYNQPLFSFKLLSELSLHQDQILRRLAPAVPRQTIKRSSAWEWEHSIPADYIKCEIIKAIGDNDISKIPSLLDVYIKAGQRKISKAAHREINKLYKKTMPLGWSCDEKPATYLIRYIAAGVIDQIELTEEEKMAVSNLLPN